MTGSRRKLVSAGLMIGGALVWALGLLADPLGLGGIPGFNWKQVAAAEIGAATVFLGVMVLARRSGDAP